MVFVCEKGGFTFTRVSEPDRCSDCGSEYSIRVATKEEEQEFLKIYEEVKNEEW